MSDCRLGQGKGQLTALRPQDEPGPKAASAGAGTGL